MIERAEVGPVRCTVSVPPRHAKTESVLHGIVWLLLRNPSMKIAYISYGDRIVQQKSRTARDYALRAGVPLREEAKALHLWLTAENGSLRATSVRGPFTGDGADLIIIDDPFKDRQDAESAINRQGVWDWFTSVVSTRLEPGGSIIVVHTRWHPDDLIGRLKAQSDDPYEDIHLKAISDDGEALWPERWPLKGLERKRDTIGPYDWNSLYQGEPRIKGGELFREPARYERPNLQDARIIIACDPAASAKNHADYSAIVVLAAHGYEDTSSADVIEVIRVQKEIPELCDDLEELQKKYSGAPVYVESKGVGLGVVQMLRALKPELTVKELNVKGDKFTRAQPASAAWNNGRIRVPLEARWLQTFLNEVTSFTGVNDKHDDQVDSLSHAWSIVNNYVSFGSSYSPLHEESYDPRQEQLEAYIAKRINEL